MNHQNRIVLFVCQGNACRSPMAEGYGKKFTDRHFDVRSAGIRPIGVDERAIQVMLEDGVDIRDQTSVGLDEVHPPPDLVVFMSPSVARKSSSIPDEARRVTWSIDDPYFASGSREEQLSKFRRVRNTIKKHVRRLVDEVDNNRQE